MCVDSCAAFYSIREKREQGNVGRARGPPLRIGGDFGADTGLRFRAVTAASMMPAPLGSVTTPEMLPVMLAQASAAPNTIATTSAGRHLEGNRIELTFEKLFTPDENHHH